MRRGRRGDERVNVRLRDALRSPFEPGKILNISLRAANGREIQPTHTETALRSITQKLAKHVRVDSRIAHNAFFSDPVFPRLKLRLDKTHHLALGLQKRGDRAQNKPEGDEAQVGNGDVHFLGNLLVRDMADVRPLHAHNARIGAKAPGKLAVAYIYGVDLGCAVLEQYVRKAAGGSAAVDTPGALDIDRKHPQRFFKLPPAAADVRERFTPHFHRGILRHGGAGLRFLLSVYIHAARHDIRLGTFTALGEAFIEHKLIKPDLFHT